MPQSKESQEQIRNKDTDIYQSGKTKRDMYT